MEIKINKKAFVVMPFKQPYDSYYPAIFKPALEAAGYEVTRGDDVFTPRPVVLDIQKSISEADIILCEMSDRNPNVFYELGLAHAIGKPAILISKKKEDIPFDLRHVRTIIYDYTLAGWEKKLHKAIKSAASSLEGSKELWPPPLASGSISASAGSDKSIRQYIELLNSDNSKEIRQGIVGLVTLVREGGSQNTIFDNLKIFFSFFTVPPPDDKIITRDGQRLYEQSFISKYFAILDMFPDDLQKQLCRTIVHNNGLKYARLSAVLRLGPSEDDWKYLLSVDDDELGEAVINSLGQQDYPFVDKLLFNAIAGNQWLTAGAAGHWLAERKPEGATEAIIKLSKHPSSFFRHSGIHALFHLNNDAAKNALNEALLEESDEYFKKEIQEMINRSGIVK